MEWVETTGRTVEEALDVALDELGVDENDVDYEVLVEPRGGLLGRLGSSEARIRARVRPLSREKPGERRRRGRSGERGSEQASEGNGSERGRRRRPPRSREPREDRSKVDEINEMSLPEQAALAAEFAAGFVEAFGVQATVNNEVTEEERVHIEIDGPEVGLLVGPRGATLSAIEELVRTYVQRRTDGHGARIDVDVAGYRAQRREALAKFATQLADRVVETGREQALEPMGPGDRKVVHDAVAEIDGVTTISEGEEPRRRVVIRNA
ncbi:MAG: RNA-binding cell elongation regulator Jag/EloR [Candidatus Rokuibacteriota bacterium]